MMRERCGSLVVSSLPERWLQDSLKKRKPPGRSQPSIFSTKDLSSSSLRYISSQLEKMKSMLRRTLNGYIKMQHILYSRYFLHQEHELQVMFILFSLIYVFLFETAASGSVYCSENAGLKHCHVVRMSQRSNSGPKSNGHWIHWPFLLHAYRLRPKGEHTSHLF